jgi:hypothetical protein
MANETVANCTAYFDITNRTWGTIGAGVGDRGVIDFNNGLIRPWIRFLGTAAAHTFDIYSAQADGDNDFAGDATTVNTWIGVVQLELGNYPTSRIPTTTVAVTRAADSCYYTLGTGDVNNIEGSLYFEFWSPTFTPSRSHYLVGLSAAGSANDLISVFLDTSGFINVNTTSTGGLAGTIIGAASLCNNTVHTCLLTYRKNELRLFIDNILIGTDSTFDVPKNISRLEIGQDNTAANQAGPCLVSNVQIFPSAIPNRVINKG